MSPNGCSHSSTVAVPFTARNSTSRPAAKEPHTGLLHSTVLLAALTQISKLDRQAPFDRYCVPQHAPDREGLQYKSHCSEFFTAIGTANGKA